MPSLTATPGTATALAGAATCNQDGGTVTSESLVTAAGASYTLTLGCAKANPNSLVFASVANGTNTQGDPSVQKITPGNGQVTIVVVNRHATLALNGTLNIAFVVFN